MTMYDTAAVTEMTELITQVLQRSGYGALQPAQLDDFPDGVDEGSWRTLVEEVGLLELGVAVEKGGAGFGPAELMGISEALGRSLYPSPFLATRMLTACALDQAGGASADGGLVALMTGSERGAMPVPPSLTTSDGPTFAVEATGTGFRLFGTAEHIPDGATATYFLVIGALSGQQDFYRVDTASAGVTVIREPELDATRPLVTVTLDGAAATQLKTQTSPLEVLSTVSPLILAAVAAEQLGGARQCLDMAVEHAKTRQQFGQPIGAFQSIKHLCADMALEVRRTETAVQHAAEALAKAGTDAAVAAHLAYATAADTYLMVTRGCVQVLGGIGFTWEHPAHLYLKRALSTIAMFGDADAHREQMLTLAGY